MFNWFSGLSLRTKTLLYLIMIITPILVTSWVANMLSAQETKAQVGRTMLQLAKQTHTTLDRDLLGIDESTIKLIQEPLVQDMGEVQEGTTDDLVKQYIALGKVVEKYSVGEAFYKGLAYSLFFPMQHPEYFQFAPSYQQLESGIFFIDPKESNWYQQAVSLKGKGFLQVLDHFGVTQPGKTLTFLRIVKDLKNGPDIGLIAVADLQKTLTNELNEIQLPSNSEIYLTDDTNHILTSVTNQRLGTRVRIPDGLLKENSGNSIVRLDHVDYLLAYHYSSNYNTKLIILTPLADITSQGNLSQRVILYLTLIYLLIVAITVALFLRSILSPLRKLSALVGSYVPGKETAFKVINPSRRLDEIGSLTFSFSKMMRRLNELVQTQYVLEIKQKETEISMLHQQINPHMLYNTLESIYWHGVAIGENEVAEMVKDLSKLMRIGLSSGRNLITISEEIEHAEAYMRLQEKRDKQRFRVKWEIDENVKAVLIPKITLQPLLENAILHGIAKMGDDGEIVVQIHDDHEGHVILRVADNGYKLVDIGRLNEIVAGQTGKPVGYGIRNVRQRIQLHFGDAYGLSYEARPGGGVIARLIIPRQAPYSENGGKQHE